MSLESHVHKEFTKLMKKHLKYVKVCIYGSLRYIFGLPVIPKSFFIVSNIGGKLFNIFLISSSVGFLGSSYIVSMNLSSSFGRSSCLMVAKSTSGHPLFIIILGIT